VTTGGAERHIIELANFLGADIITSGYNAKIANWLPIKNKVINLGNITIRWSKPVGILVESPIRFLLNRNKFKYDINIYLGSSIYGSNKRNKNIYYCLTPNKHLYDWEELKIYNIGFLSKLIHIFYKWLFYKKDQTSVKSNFDLIITQSEYIKLKIKNIYGRNAIAIYPSIDTSKFEFKRFGDFFLTVARLHPSKRVDLIARAFIKIPHKKLIIVGNGPEKKKISEIIKKSKNIQMLGEVSEEKLIDLYSSCLATIYMPVHEDFGLIPLEGMASGKACIAVNEGGCRETVINGKTGYLIPAVEKEIIKTVTNFDTIAAKKMKNSCIEHAKKFDISICSLKWKQLLANFVNLLILFSSQLL
jgi:glycosyltransferase involved in cell wall biosynthesis